ncbi:MAG TPA: C45 family autoproteolytic acyltransferase/hydrolase, partial [Halanaerobiales bacterium]|nr:C45 family autoproteolytic acyltransferase/hydrolase [Halanaerobiales bacterium]
SIDGLPYMIMLRQLLQYADNLEEAISIIKKTPRTVGLNILLASAVDGRAVVVESSASRLFIREAEDYIYTTNRFNSDYMKKYQSDGWMSSHLRDMRFEELREIYRRELDYKAAVKILRDKYAPGSSAHSGYVSGIQNEGTMASLVFRPEHLQVFVNKRTVIPVPEGEYYGFDCKELWESKQAIKPFEIIPEAPNSEYNRRWLTVREAELAHNKGDNELVKELMEPVVTAEPESETPLLLLGISYLRSGESDKGIELLERLVNLPKIAQPYHLLEAYFWLGSTYDIVKEDRQQAVEYYKKARELDIPDLLGDNDMLLKLVKAGVEKPLVLEDGRIVAQ